MEPQKRSICNDIYFMALDSQPLEQIEKKIELLRVENPERAEKALQVVKELIGEDNRKKLTDKFISLSRTLFD